MNAEQIRAKAANPGYDRWHDGTEQTQILVEIAAQLAEMNEHLAKIANPPMLVVNQDANELSLDDFKKTR